MPKILTLEQLSECTGSEIGVTDWVDVTQEKVNAFARVGGDHQWIHLDVDRARRESPFGGTIAHGYLILSFAPKMLDDIFVVKGLKMGINYGLNKVRFISPLRVGSKLRLRAELMTYQTLEDCVQVVIKHTFEGSGLAKPVCVAEVIKRYYVDDGTLS